MIAGRLNVSDIVTNPCIGFGTTCASVKPTKLLVILVILLPYWISNTDGRPTKLEVPPLERLTLKRCIRWNFVAVCQ